MATSRCGEGREEGNTPSHSSTGGWFLDPTVVGTVPGKSYAEQWWASPLCPNRCGRHTPIHAGTYKGVSRLIRNSAIWTRGEFFRKFCKKM